MKKILLIIAVVGAVASMSSCKKDYTCECVTDTAGVETSVTHSLENQKKGDAEDACGALESSVTMGGVTVSTTCELK